MDQLTPDTNGSETALFPCFWCSVAVKCVLSQCICCCIMDQLTPDTTDISETALFPCFVCSVAVTEHFILNLNDFIVIMIIIIIKRITALLVDYTE